MMAGSINSGKRVYSSSGTICGFAGAGEEEVAFAGILGESGGAGEFVAGFLEAAEFGEEIAPDGGKQVIALERRLGEESVE